MQPNQILNNLKEESKSYPVQDWLSTIYGDEPYQRTKLGTYIQSMVEDERSRVDKITKLVELRQENNYDAIPAVTGAEGVGKSSLAYWLCKGVNRRNHLPFNMEQNILFHQEGVDQYEMLRRRVLTLPERSSLSVDEAIKTMYSRNWNKKQQKDQNIVFTTIRERKLFVPLCIPALAELDSFFKNFRVLFWLHIFAKGKAVLFVKDPNPFNTDPFNTKQAKKIIDEHLKREDRFDVDVMIQTLQEYVPNFITWFNYKPMPSAEEIEYKRLKNLYNVEMAKDELTGTARANKIQEDSIVLLFESNPKWTTEKLAKQFNLSERKIRELIKKARGEKSE